MGGYPFAWEQRPSWGQIFRCTGWGGVQSRPVSLRQEAPGARSPVAGGRDHTPAPLAPSPLAGVPLSPRHYPPLLPTRAGFRGGCLSELAGLLSGKATRWRVATGPSSAGPSERVKRRATMRRVGSTSALSSATSFPVSIAGAETPGRQWRPCRLNAPAGSRLPGRPRLLPARTLRPGQERNHDERAERRRFAARE